MLSYHNIFICRDHCSTLYLVLKFLFGVHRNVRNTQKLNERMLEMGVEDSESWHRQYKDSAYIFIGNILFPTVC